jgi:hypothetical protein
MIEHWVALICTIQRNPAADLGFQRVAGAGLLPLYA